MPSAEPSGPLRIGGVPLAKIKIENVVASTSLGEQLDLQAIALALGGAEYEPEQFPGLIYRLKEPKTATLLFRSGKVVCTGAKSLEHVKTAIDMVAKQIEAAGIPIKKNPVIEVQNIVASSDLGTEINLNAIAISLGLEKVEYEPEQFPGLVYRIDVLIGATGTRPMRFRPTVKAVIPNRELRWLGRLGLPRLFDGEHIFQIEPLGSMRTRFIQREQFRGLLVPFLARSLNRDARRGFEEMNRALQARINVPPATRPGTGKA